MKYKTIYILLASICNILANPLRIEIIEVLSENEINITDLLAVTGELNSSPSQHLSLMATNGILIQRREGTKSPLQTGK